jgi:transposase-like protein
MDVSRAAYSRELKIAAMRALEAGATGAEIARKYQLSPHFLECWRGEWRATGELAFPGFARRGVSLTAVDDARRPRQASPVEMEISSVRANECRRHYGSKKLFHRSLRIDSA